MGLISSVPESADNFHGRHVGHAELPSNKVIRMCVATLLTTLMNKSMPQDTSWESLQMTSGLCPDTVGICQI